MISPVRKNAAPAQQPRRRGSLDQVLINAAMDLFASYGYRGTSLARIAHAAGVTKGALYWHFADKEEFFIAVVSKVLGEWELVFEKSGHATNAVEFRAEFARMFDTLAALNEKNPWVTRLLLIIALESHKIGPRVLRSMRQANLNAIASFRELLERGQRLGVLDAGARSELGGDADFFELPGACDAMVPARSAIRSASLAAPPGTRVRAPMEHRQTRAGLSCEIEPLKPRRPPRFLYFSEAGARRGATIWRPVGRISSAHPNIESSRTRLTTASAISSG